MEEIKPAEEYIIRRRSNGNIGIYKQTEVTIDRYRRWKGSGVSMMGMRGEWLLDILDKALFAKEGGDDERTNNF